MAASVKADTVKGYPRGWFVVCFADELDQGAVKRLEYFGQRLVAYRKESGAPVVLDAYCPHLGADLSEGGTVVGDTVRCPFHAWRFGPDGRCVQTPYADKIPPNGDRVRAWPVRERNGLLFIWHDWAGDTAPDWEIPVLAEYGDPQWTAWSRALLSIDTDPREVLENVADRAHFGPVHQTHISHFANEFKDHTATQFNKGVAYPKGGGQDSFELKATYFGPAYQITWMDGVLSSRLLLAHTPVRPGRIDLRFGTSLRIVKGDPARAQSFARHYTENLERGFRQDIAIWENKVWRDRPVLCDGDGPIMKLRKWYGTFYAPDAGHGAAVEDK